MQLRKRFRTVGEAKAWHVETVGELASGMHVSPSDLTVAQACQSWLDAKCSRVKSTTAAAYRSALATVIDRYGPMPVQKLTKRDVEALIMELRTGSTDRELWKRTSINPMLARWKAVWVDLHAYMRQREPFLHLALMGLRCAELAGWRWSAIDLDAETPN